MKRQATKAANLAQVRHTIERQKRGMGAEFAHRHPILDAVLGSLVLLATVGGAVAYWIKVGAGV